MGKRKRLTAEARRNALRQTAFARLNDCPSSPRKMRLVADMIRGQRVEKALNLLKFSTKEASGKMEKLLLSALNNWQNKNENLRMEDQQLFVSEVYVDGGTMLKRLRTAPQGRGYRIRKRSNHITLVLGSGVAAPPAEEEVTAEAVAEAPAEVQEEAKAPARKKPVRARAKKAAAKTRKSKKDGPEAAPSNEE